MTLDAAALEQAIRYVEECYPRTIKLLLEGHSNGEPPGKDPAGTKALVFEIAEVHGKVLARANLPVGSAPVVIKHLQNLTAQAMVEGSRR